MIFKYSVGDYTQGLKGKMPAYSPNNLAVRNLEATSLKRIKPPTW